MLNVLKNGWGGRIRTHEWRYQKPLPYHLATPQRKPISIKSQIIPKILLIAFSLYSILSPQSVLANDLFESRLILNSPSNSPIKTLAFFKDGLLYSNSQDFNFNFKKVNLLNEAHDENGDLGIRHVILDDETFYLSSSQGTFQNYKKIFSRLATNHTLLTKEKIFIASENGIYSSEHSKKDFMFDYKWHLMTSSPIKALFLSPNKSGSNIEFISSELGFYHYDSKKKSWINRSHGLESDFQDSYGLGRFYVDHKSSKEKSIYLPSSSGFFISKDLGKSWIKKNEGLESNNDGFYTLREVIPFEDKLFLISSTGLYYSDFDEIKWHKVRISNSQSNEDGNEDYHSIAIKNSKNPETKQWERSLLVGSSNGNIFEIKKEMRPNNSYQSSTSPNKYSEQKRRENTKSIDQNPIAKNHYKQRNETIHKIKEIISKEPKVTEVHKEALKFAGIATGKKFNRYKMQARLRNALPSFEVFSNNNNAGTFSLETDGSEDFESDTGSITSKANRARASRRNNGRGSGMKLSWGLNKLIYDPEVNDINTNARITANIRENILTEITQIYFARKESLIEYLELKFKEPESFDKEYIKKQIEVEQYTAQIDARTGGWFSEEINDRIKEAYI